MSENKSFLSTPVGPLTIKGYLVIGTFIAILGLGGYWLFGGSSSDETTNKTEVVNNTEPGKEKGLWDKVTSIFSKEEQKSAVPTGAGSLPNFSLKREVGGPKPAKMNLPSSTPANLSSQRARVLMIPWSAIRGMNLAGGGPTPTQGSLFEAANLNVFQENQPSFDTLKSEIEKAAVAMSQGQLFPQTGAMFVVIMGDGAETFVASVSPNLVKKLGPNFALDIVAPLGFSQGEDGFYIPPSWKDDPTRAHGQVLIVYPGDGDWAIAMAWCILNKVKVNPSLKTYDPNALNIVYAEDHLKAVEIYNQGFRESRVKVGGGKFQLVFGFGKEDTVKASVGTWTPGDELLVKGRGGLVTGLSTAPGQNESQMAATVIGIRHFTRVSPEGKAWTKKFLDSIYRANEQIIAYDDANRKASDILARITGMEDGEYWYRVYNRTPLTDRFGNRVEVGGSRVISLADASKYYGVDGGRNLYNDVYNFFGKIMQEQYPEDMKSFPAPETVVNTQILAELYNEARTSEFARTQNVSSPTYQSGTQIKDVQGRVDLTIQFVVNSAELTPAGKAQLLNLHRTLSLNTAYIEIHGHTDSSGDPELNRRLSNDRAESVMRFFRSLDPARYPIKRFTAVEGHGSDKPIAGRTPEQLRRVEIVVGN